VKVWKRGGEDQEESIKIEGEKEEGVECRAWKKLTALKGKRGNYQGNTGLSKVNHMSGFVGGERKGKEGNHEIRLKGKKSSCSNRKQGGENAPSN